MFKHFATKPWDLFSTLMTLVVLTLMLLGGMSTAHASGMRDVFVTGSIHHSVDPFPGEHGHVKAMVTRSALRHGVPPALAHGVVKVESRYKCGAKNPRSSATGIMQTLTRTARGVGVHGNLRDCATGLEAGMRYLRQAYQRAGGNMCAAATLYNRGVGNRPSCSGYGRKVISLAGL